MGGSIYILKVYAEPLEAPTR